MGYFYEEETVVALIHLVRYEFEDFTVFQCTVTTKPQHENVAIVCKRVCTRPLCLIVFSEVLS